MTTIRVPRIALYSHDALGLGHIRRNLAIATALSKTSPAPDILLLAGIAEAANLPRPPHTEVVVIPSIAKGPDGEYHSRQLSMDFAEILEMRTKTLTALLTSFQPDLLIVDKHPRGFRNELVPALTELSDRRETTIVLGLRDILDAPADAARDWQRDRAAESIQDWYDEVWIYGDATVYDLTAHLDLPPKVHSIVRHVGYLANGRLQTAPIDLPTERFALGVVGGGADGFDLALAFAAAHSPVDRVLICGPQMPPNQVARLTGLAAADATLHVLSQVPDALPWIAAAEAVIAMGGYNTVCECLACNAPLLIVPRVTPRLEQLVRAQVMTQHGRAEFIHPAELTSAGLSDWLDHTITAGSEAKSPGPPITENTDNIPSPAAINVDGLSTISALAQELLQGTSPRYGAPKGT